MNILVLNPSDQHNFIHLDEKFPEHHFTYAYGDTMTQQQVDSCDVIIGNPKFHVDLNRENIKAIFLYSAGSDQYCKEGVLNKNTRLCNASGTYGTAIAEYAIGQLLTINKNLMTYHNNMKEHTWKGLSTGKEIYHSHVVIIGLGDIGYQIAKRLKPFGCYITGVKRRAMDALDSVDEIITADKLTEVLPEADTVIMALPNSKATYHLMNKETLSLMKDDAVLINVGRGNAIDEEALLEVLHEGKLYGVGLDVTETEPLSKNSPLWDEERVLITPHCSGGYVWQSTQEYFLSLMEDNLHRLENHEELRNEVDFVTGYRKKTVY